MIPVASIIPKKYSLPDPFAANLISLMHFNGDLVDKTGKVWTAHGGGLTYPSGKFGSGSGLFDGTNDYLTTPAASDWRFASSNFCIDFWVKTTHTTPYRQLFSIDTAYLVNFGSVFLEYANGTPPGTFTLQLNPNSGNATGRITIPTTIAINDGNWHHIEFDRSGNNYYSFVDGVLDASVSGSFTQRALADSSVYLGCWLSSGSSAADYFDGAIDDWRVTAACRHTASFTPPAFQAPEI